MSGADDVPPAVGALIETLHRLDSVAALVDALPAVDAPSIRGASGLQDAVDRLVDQCDRLQHRAADELRQLSGGLGQLIIVLAATEGLSPLASDDRHMGGAEPPWEPR